MSDAPKSSVTIRMPSALLEQIKKNSEQNERSINSEIVHSLSALYGRNIVNMKEGECNKDNNEIMDILKSVGFSSALSTLASPLVPIAIFAIHNMAKSINQKK